MTALDQAGRAICLVIGLCGNNKFHHMTNAERWPGHDPLTTRPAVVLVGDSITKGWPLPAPEFLNHAVGGQRIGEVMAYIYEDAFIYNPQAIIVGGGVNDFRQGGKLDGVIQARLHIMREAKARGIKVYMLNISDFDSSQYGCRIKDADSISKFNFAIAGICAASGDCTLIDIAGAMGTFDQSLHNDCIHPNAEAYRTRFDPAFAAVR